MPLNNPPVIIQNSGTTQGAVNTVNLNAGLSASVSGSVATIGITGTITTANITPGTSAQVLMSNATPATTWTTISGDVAISATGVVTVSSIHGATVPIAGSLTTGNAPYVSGASALSYSALNLAGGSGWVTGNLPIANLAGGGAGTLFLQSVSGTNSYAVISAGSLPTITLTGQVTGSASGGSIATTLTSGNLPTITLTGDVSGANSGGTITTSVATITGGTSGILNTTGFQLLTSTTTTADFGGGVGIISIGQVTTVPTTLPSTSVGLWTSAGQVLITSSPGLQFPNIQTNPINITTQALASTSAAGGTSGTQTNIKAQAGQATTFASGAGGTGGLLFFAGGAGGNSATGVGGSGGNNSLNGGAGGNATAGTSNGGAGGNVVLTTGTGGTSAGGAAGANGDVIIKIASTQLLDISGATPGSITFNNTSAIPAITQTAVASAAVVGVAGNQFSIISQAGQATSGTSHTGGTGGALALTAGAGGATSGAGAASPGGIGGSNSLVAGAGGAASAGTNAGGAGGNIIIGSGAGGTSSGGTAGVAGNIQVQVAGSTFMTISNHGLSLQTVTKTTSYVIDSGSIPDYQILCNQSGAINITLPPPTAGRQLLIKDISGTAETNNITIVRNASESIEGIAASYVIVGGWESVHIISDGTNWFLAT